MSQRQRPSHGLQANHCQARDDMVILAHIREQHRLSLQSYALHGS